MTTSCIEFIKGHPKFVKKIHEEVVPSLKSMGTKTCAKEKQTFEEQPSRLLFHQKSTLSNTTIMSEEGPTPKQKWSTYAK